MICPKCGFTIPDGTQFCTSCGAKLSTPPPTPPAPKTATLDLLRVATAPVPINISVR